MSRKTTPPPSFTEFDEISHCHPVTCVVARSIAALEGQDKIDFAAALAKRLPHDEGWRYGNNTLSTFLRRRGLAGGAPAVGKHRDGACCCVRP